MHNYLQQVINASQGRSNDIKIELNQIDEERSQGLRHQMPSSPNQPLGAERGYPDACSMKPFLPRRKSFTKPSTAGQIRHAKRYSPYLHTYIHIHICVCLPIWTNNSHLHTHKYIYIYIYIEIYIYSFYICMRYMLYAICAICIYIYKCIYIYIVHVLLSIYMPYTYI